MLHICAASTLTLCANLCDKEAVTESMLKQGFLSVFHSNHPTYSKLYNRQHYGDNSTTGYICHNYTSSCRVFFSENLADILVILRFS